MKRIIPAAAHVLGTPWALLVSLAAVATGFWFGWSDQWWTWIDRSVYLATLWIALIIQGAQNRDTLAIQRKLDELIRVTDRASDTLAGIEKTASERELEA